MIIFKESALSFIVHRGWSWGQAADLSCLVLSEFPRSSALFSFFQLYVFTFHYCPPVPEFSDLLAITTSVVPSYFSLDISLESGYWPLVNFSSDTLNILMTLLNAFLVTSPLPPSFSFDSLIVSVSLLRAATGSYMLYFSPIRTLNMLIINILNPCFDNSYICFVSESGCNAHFIFYFCFGMTCDFLLKVGFASVLGSQDLVFIWLGVWLFNVFESIPTRGFRSLYCPWSGFLLGSVFLSVAQRGSVPLFRLGLIIINRRGFLCHNMVWLRGKFYSVLIKSHSLPVSGLYFHGYFNLSSKVMVVAIGF